MKILVTGANGHLGANLIAELVAAGHTVRGSVRALADASRTAHLRALGKVELVEADLDTPDSLRAAMEGQDAVMHTAAVYQLYAPGQEDAIVRASVQGVEAAMRAARDAGVKRLVVTSSTVTLPMTRAGDRPADETHWATDLRVPYVRAKTEGERHAWAMAEALGLDLATVLPGAFGGPGFQRNTPTIDFIEAILKGALQLGAPPINYPYVDVRDVARAHRMVLESGAQGRFLAVNDHQPTVTEIALTMHAIDRSIPRPLLTLPGFLMPAMPVLEGLASRINGSPRTLTAELAGMLRGRVWNVSNEKSRRKLGWSPQVSVKQSLADTIAAIRARENSRAAG
jgi:dihydroflavonol-4-reductase